MCEFEASHPPNKWKQPNNSSKTPSHTETFLITLFKVWYMPVIPAHGRLRQEDLEFKASLVSLQMSSRTARITQRNPFSKKSTKKFNCFLFMCVCVCMLTHICSSCRNMTRVLLFLKPESIAGVVCTTSCCDCPPSQTTGFLGNSAVPPLYKKIPSGLTEHLHPKRVMRPSSE